jgi:hypothetical protein
MSGAQKISKFGSARALFNDGIVPENFLTVIDVYKFEVSGNLVRREVYIFVIEEQ